MLLGFLLILVALYMQRGVWGLLMQLLARLRGERTAVSAQLAAGEKQP